MRRVSLCLVAAFVLACGGTTITEPTSLTIRVEGTVTAADDGSPVVGAVTEILEGRPFQEDRSVARDVTDTSGHYSFSFVETPSCIERPRTRNLLITHPDFLFVHIGGFHEPHITCTEELQTIDVQLVRVGVIQKSDNV